jgi:hypothetical protein
MTMVLRRTVFLDLIVLGQFMYYSQNEPAALALEASLFFLPPFPCVVILRLRAELITVESFSSRLFSSLLFFSPSQADEVDSDQ